VIVEKNATMLKVNLEEENKIKICRRCHRKLKDEKSILLGYGATCYKKIKKHKETYLFEMEDGNQNV
jgi:hypothetical protein